MRLALEYRQTIGQPPRRVFRCAVPTGWHVLRSLRIALYVLTVATAAVALFIQPALSGAVQRGALRPLWMFLPVSLFVVLFLLYAIDRWILVKRRRYPAGRAFFQVAFGLIFALLLLPNTIREWNTRRPQGMERLLGHPDPEIRRVTVEALGFRERQPQFVDWVVAMLDDEDPEVRRAAQRVLALWSGHEIADVAGIRAWASQLSKTSTRGGAGGSK